MTSYTTPNDALKAAKNNDDTLYVINRSGGFKVPGGGVLIAGDINLQVRDGGEILPIKIHKTWAPQDLGLQAAVSVIRTNPIFRRLVMSKIIEIIPPPDAERTLTSSQAQIELRRTANRNQGAVDILNGESQVASDAAAEAQNLAIDNNLLFDPISRLKSDKMKPETCVKLLGALYDDVSLDDINMALAMDMPPIVQKQLLDMSIAKGGSDPEDSEAVFEDTAAIMTAPAAPMGKNAPSKPFMKPSSPPRRLKSSGPTPPRLAS